MLNSRFEVRSRRRVDVVSVREVCWAEDVKVDKRACWGVGRREASIVEGSDGVVRDMVGRG